MKRHLNADTLFTEPRPCEYGYRKHAEDDFRYMNLHADAPVVAARELVEYWYKHFPSDHRGDLVSRFRSKNQKQHAGAFWELYLHELFLRMGYDVQIHPHLGNKGTRPDFLLMRDGVPFAFVEARLAGLLPDEVTSAKRLERELHDALDRVRSPNFFLRVEEVKSAPVRPSFKQLTKAVEAWLETLEPDTPIETFVIERHTHMRFEWEQSGWFLSLQVIPKSPEHRGKAGGRSVGAFSMEVQWLDSKGELRRALSEKAGKYEKCNLPFLIAINYMGVHCDRIDWTDALYGTQAINVSFAEDDTHFQEPFRKNDGFWSRAGSPLKTHVSAVIAAWHISPWSMGAHPLELYAHFAAEHPIDLDGNLPCWYVPTNKDELVMRPGRSSAEILGLPEVWPGKWDAPIPRAQR